MASIAIITGPPGAGKTTLSHRLSETAPRGLHLRSDVFYGFPARTIDPTTPESHDQNAAIIRAVTRAAISFAQSHYDVYLDGIFGPWFLPVISRELRDAGLQSDYVILRTNSDEALRRVAARLSEPDGIRRDPDRWEATAVVQMNRAFRQLGRFEAHVIDTTRLTPDQVLAEYRGRARGAFQMGPS